MNKNSRFTELTMGSLNPKFYIDPSYAEWNQWDQKYHTHSRYKDKSGFYGYRTSSQDNVLRLYELAQNYSFIIVIFQISAILKIQVSTWMSKNNSILCSRAESDERSKCSNRCDVYHQAASASGIDCLRSWGDHGPALLDTAHKCVINNIYLDTDILKLIKPLAFDAKEIMPRAPKVSKDDAIDVVKNVVQYFTTDQLPKYTSQVWKDMSAQLKSAWSAHDVYTAVREDRRGILSTAREKLGIIVIQDPKSTFESESDHEEVSVNLNNSCSAPLKKFDLHLTEEEWDAIKPRGKVQYKGRDKYVLTPWVWSNTISIALWQQLKIPCAFSFKRADVALSSDESTYTITIPGSCKSERCGNILTATGEKHSAQDGLTLCVETHDTRGMFHENIKRPLNGKRRREVQQELKVEGCKRWQNKQARLLMDEGDPEPPILPKQDTLRNAKKERINADLELKPKDGRDIVRTIEEMKLTEEYAGLIHNVGSNPFFVFYSSPAQMQVYKDYCRANRGTVTIILDATGSVVKRLLRSDGQLSGHIFLYSIVINFENVTLSVHQMLSETHVTDVILYWLKQWNRRGAPVPNITVTDYSRALIAALCFVYNNITIKAYVEICFAIAANPDHPIIRPVTLHRIDVAHLIHMVCLWKCFQSLRQRSIKEFFVRCVSLMVDAQSISEFGRVFELTCAVGLQPCEDSEMDLDGVRSTKEARKTLEAFISDRNIEVDFEAAEIEKKDEDFSDGFGPCETIDDPNTVDEPNTLMEWLTQHLERAKVIVRKGENLNPFYLPDFIDKLFLLAKEFPLWSNAGIPFNAERATSSYVEGHFNDIKTRVFKNTPLPIRVDKFIKIQIRDIIGETLLFSAKLVNFDRYQHLVANSQLNNLVNTEKSQRKQIRTEREKKKKKAISTPYDTDLMAQENWRAKASTENIGNGVSSDDSADDCSKCFGVPILQSSRILSTTENINNDSTAEVSSTNVTVEIDRLDNSHLSDHSYYKNSELDDKIDFKETTVDIVSKQKIIESPIQQCQPNVPEKERVQPHPIIVKKPSIKEVESLKKTSKYFKLYPEIRQMNLLTSKTGKPVLLPNGSINTMPLNIKGKKVFVKSTCAFDSLVHALMIGALDDCKYADMIETSTNETLQFVRKLMITGVKKEILQDRGVLLDLLDYSCNSEISTERRILSYSMDATDSITNLVKKALETCPSVYVEEDCPKCGVQTSSLPFLSPNHRKIKNNIANLQDALDIFPEIYNVHCKRCKGKLTLHNKLNFHILIDLDIRGITASGVAKEGLRCKLADIPTTLCLSISNKLRVTYRLVAVVSFSSNHFVTHCRRASGTWQQYNDLAREITSSKMNGEIEPHLAVYIKQH